MAKARDDRFRHWLTEVTPTWTWDWAYQLYIQEHLNKVTRGTIKRLMLFLPPRHGKSEKVTVRYPVFRINYQNDFRTIVGAYNQTLASKFSRKSIRIARQIGIPLATDRKAVDDWETTAGGGIRAVGVGGGVTGQGGNLIIIDDPVKNREEANSVTYRDKVWDWYTDDLYTRLEPGGAIILIMTRWHEDDLAGRILASEDAPNWTIINLPAEAEENDPLGRTVGEALCPARYDEVALAKIRTVLGKAYYGLYQQRPVEQEGEMFKRSWFDFVDAVPKTATRIRYWDKAATQDGGDYTVGTLIARDNDGVYYIEDIVRGQWSTGERNRIMRQTAELDGKNVRIWWEEEPGSSGKDVSVALVKLLAGWPVHAERVTGDKVTRAEPFAAQCEAKNVKLKRGKWNAAWLDELTSFPAGKHDDQVDSASGGFNKIAVDNWLIY